MSKLKGFYKNNRIFVILMGIAFVCLAIILVIVLAYFVGQTSGDAYGNRLNGIETVEIADSKIKEIEATVKKNEIIDKVDINVVGKIIYINIFLNSGKGSDAKNIAIKTLDSFSDEEKNFYDFSFAFDLTTDTEDNIFPIMGYKKSDNTIISWTNFSE